MADNNRLQVTVDGQTFTMNTIFSFKWQDLLDERLDEARITINFSKTPIFPRMAKVSITCIDMQENTLQKNYYISSDLSVENPVGSGLYKHDLSLIEETKFLEGFIIDSLTYTNDLGRLYTDGAVPVIPNRTVFPPISEDIWLIYPDPQETYITPLQLGKEFTFKSVYDTFVSCRPEYVRKEPNGEDLTKAEMTIKQNGNVIFETKNYKVDKTLVLEAGDYELTYIVTQSNEIERYTCIYTFLSVENTQPLPKWNIATVVERLLLLAEPLRVGDTQRFTLDESVRPRLESVPASEFAFTGNTLKEALDLVGGFIHAIPRLNNNVVTFDFLGETMMKPNLKYKYITNVLTSDIESYCTSIDSRVDNLVNVVDDEQGTFTEPYYDGYETVRTETVFARIEDGNMIIPTSLKIQYVTNLDSGILPGQTYKGGTITPYVFERAEYNQMSSISGDYPRSKAYALVYTQGEKNISGLNFKNPDVVSPALKNYSIINILRNTSGNAKFETDDYPKLAFQVSYKPIFSSRAKQTKSYIGDLGLPRTLAYNQGANIVESNYYGENMKGVVARMGNVERTCTFLGQNLTSIPKVGQLFDEEYYIAGVAVEFLPYDYKCTLSLSKDFNRLSQYIGINSQKRFYEVSEKAAYDRDMNYTDYLLIGDSASVEDTIYGTPKGMQAFLNIFQQNGVPLSAVVLRGESEEGNPQAEVILPVISTAFGNSMVFTTAYEDNFSAGNQAVYVKEGSVDGYFQQGTAYCDVYGRLDKLHIKYFDVLPAPDNFDSQTEIGAALPKNIQTFPEELFGTGTRPLIVKKDSREILAINYQIEFVTNRPQMIIGSAMARNCPLIRPARAEHTAALYVLPNRIGKFADKLNLSGATFVDDYADKVRIFSGRIMFQNATAPVYCQAWAMVDKATGELLFGENRTLEAGAEIPLPVMTPRHNIFNMKEGETET